jgi:hypothetical protein
MTWSPTKAVPADAAAWRYIYPDAADAHHRWQSRSSCQKTAGEAAVDEDRKEQVAAATAVDAAREGGGTEAGDGHVDALLARFQSVQGEARRLEREADERRKQEQVLRLQLAMARNATSGLLMLGDHLLVSVAGYLDIYDLGCGLARVCRRFADARVVHTVARLRLRLEPAHIQLWAQRIQYQRPSLPSLRLLWLVQCKRLYLRARIKKLTAEPKCVTCTASWADPYGEPPATIS